MRSGNFYSESQPDMPPATPPTPLLAYSAAICGGIILGRNCICPPQVLFIILASSLLCSLVLMLPIGGFPRQPARHIWIMCLLCLGFGAFAALRYNQMYYLYPPHHVVNITPRTQARLVRVRGYIVTKPYISRSQGALRDYDFIHAPGTIFALRCQSVKTGNGWQDIAGLCQVRIKQPDLRLRQGYRVEICGWLSRRRGISNPGQFDPTDYYHAARNLVTLTANQVEAVKILSAPSPKLPFVTRTGRWLQQFALSALLEEEDISSPRQADNEKTSNYRNFIAALVLGQRQRLPEELYDTFMRTGTVHFLSVSGFHVGIIAGFAWGVGWLLRLRRSWQGLLVLLVVIVYLLMVPPRPPVLRAGIICIVLALAWISRRPGNALNLLAFAAGIILLWRPLDLFNPGFQLSFIIVLAIICFVPTIYQRKIAPIGIRPIELQPENSAQQHTSWWQYLGKGMLAFIWGLLVVALVAWLAGLPLTAYHFHRIAVWGVLGSVILFPLISLTLLLGVTKLLLTFILPSLAGWAAVPLACLAQTTLAVTAFLSRLPFNTINTASPPPWFILLFYLILLSTALYIRRHNEIPRWSLHAILLWLIALAWLLPFVQKYHPAGSTIINVLDIGHGAAVFIQSPSGYTIAGDVGSLSDFNLTRRIVAPFLRSRGIQRINALFISHPNVDHYNGVIDLCQTFPVDKIYLADYFPRQADYTARAFLQEIKKLHIPLVYIKAGDTLGIPIGPSHAETADTKDHIIETLWPPPSLKTTNTNDTSLVLRYADKNGSILLCGDIGGKPQQYLSQSPVNKRLATELLLLPHHGSPGSLLPEFIRAVHPRICINSSAVKSSSSRAKLRDILAGVPLYSTSTSGAVIVTLTGNELLVHTGP